MPFWGKIILQTGNWAQVSTIKQYRFGLDERISKIYKDKIVYKSSIVDFTSI